MVQRGKAKGVVSNIYLAWEECRARSLPLYESPQVQIQREELDYEYDFIDDSHSLLFLNSCPASWLGPLGSAPSPILSPPAWKAAFHWLNRKRSPLLRPECSGQGRIGYRDCHSPTALCRRGCSSCSRMWRQADCTLLYGCVCRRAGTCLFSVHV